MAFDQAFAHTVGEEGRYSNNPADRGGETMFGVTVAVARANGYQGPMEEMPLAVAQGIYKATVWDALHLDLVDPLSPAIAAKIFDIAVNCGNGIPIPFLQRALNAYNRQQKDYPDMLVDGHMGPATAAALGSFLTFRGPAGEKVLLGALTAQQGVRYLAIAEKDPTQETFEFGWWQRALA